MAFQGGDNVHFRGFPPKNYDFLCFPPGIFDVFDANQISTSCFNIFDNFDSIFPNIHKKLPTLVHQEH